MRVGMYVDGFNLYYGLKSQSDGPGWKWLDLKGLAILKLQEVFPNARNFEVSVTYCTAERSDYLKPQSLADQKSYLAALKSLGCEIQLGYYLMRRFRGLITDSKGRSISDEYLLTFDYFDGTLGPEGEAAIKANFKGFEEKGSDVNLATALLRDAITRKIDMALVVSNDGDLAGSINLAKTYVPVWLLNPKGRNLTPPLKGSPEYGTGEHRWLNITIEDAKVCQVEGLDEFKPQDW